MPRPPKKSTGYTPKNAAAKASRPPKASQGARPAPPPPGHGKKAKPSVDSWSKPPAPRGAKPARDAVGRGNAGETWDRGAAWAQAKSAKAAKHAKFSKPRPEGPRAGTPRLAAGQARSQQVQRQAWGHTAPPSRGRLEELLVGHGVSLPAAVLDKVWAYHQILRKNNHDLDLTRLIGFETIVQRHYADCLILHKMVKGFFGGWPSPMVDIGTGAGFPGLMIKIASPETKLILSEPRNVRVDYLNNTIQELGLKDIEVFGHKFTSKSFDRPLKGAITRAFEPFQKTLLRLEKSLQVGGLAMFMKGPGVDEELAQPIPANYKLVRDERYRIPKTTLDRAFVVFERIA